LWHFITTQSCSAATCTDKSCVKADTCQATTDCTLNDYCHLCKDRECKKCINYTTCEAGQCLASAGKATNATGECVCTSGNGRLPGTNDICKACHTDCLTCDESGTGTYKNCLTCGNSKYQVDIDGSHFWCSNYCPKGYTPAGTPPSCAAPTDFLIYADTFELFAGSWLNNGITLTLQDPFQRNIAVGSRIWKCSIC
jgi:hypothetical protein